MSIWEQSAAEQDERIGRLANEAAIAGDTAQVQLCETALGCGSGIGAGQTARGNARRECLRVIAAAEVQS